MPKIDSDGCTIHVEVEGPEHAPVLMLSNSLGTINPVAEICERARKRGIVTLVDAAQSAGHRPVDVQQIGCDFLALSGHKMCGPTGIGVLYGRGELLEEMPPFHGGGEMILSVDFDKVSFKKAPHRFEAGTPDISGAIGLHADGHLDVLDCLLALAHLLSDDAEQVQGIGMVGIGLKDLAVDHLGLPQVAGLVRLPCQRQGFENCCHTPSILPHRQPPGK